jgi:DNA invertase Pin-like site-specific DNA recombinase
MVLAEKHSERAYGRRWAAYMRVSSAGQTVDLQRHAIEMWSKSLPPGDEVIFFEEKLSSRKYRPIKYQLYKEALKREWDGIVMFKIDRWARTVGELVIDFKAMADKRVILVSTSDLGTISMENPMGKFMISVLGAFAELERDMIKERSMAGQQAKKAKGESIGRPEGSKDTTYRKKSGYHLRWDREGKYTREQPSVPEIIPESSKKVPCTGQMPPPISDPENEHRLVKIMEGKLKPYERKVLKRPCPGCGKRFGSMKVRKSHERWCQRALALRKSKRKPKVA